MESPELMPMQTAETVEPQTEAPNVRLKINVEWEPEDAEDVEYLKTKLDEIMHKEFAEIYQIQYNLHEVVREKVNDPVTGQMMWACYPNGAPIEHWDRVTKSVVQQFVMAGSAALLPAQDRLSDAFAEAVVAKYAYDDAYDKAYSAQLSGTIGDKTARAKRRTVDERWLALFKSLYQTRANKFVSQFDAQVRRMDNMYRGMPDENSYAYRIANGM